VRGGNNVTGSLGSLAQSTLANVAQSFGVQQIKTIADSFGETAKDANGKELTNSDGTKIFKPTETSEAVRTALQGLTACAGQAAGGGECSSAALGAASSVVLNNLFATGPGGNAALHPDGSPLTPDEQTERANLVSTLVATLTTALGGDANAATTSAIIETLNNQAEALYGGFVLGCAYSQTLRHCARPPVRKPDFYVGSFSAKGTSILNIINKVTSITEIPIKNVIYSGGIGPDSIAGFVSLNLSIAVDNAGNLYISLGSGVSTTVGASFSLTANWIAQAKNPTGDQISSFLTGKSVAATIGTDGVVVQGTYSPGANSSKAAIGVGIGTPQVSVTAGNGWTLKEFWNGVVNWFNKKGK
jgi:hypothetical protein